MYWAEKDVRMLKKINSLIIGIVRNPGNGLAGAEPLKHELSGWWSRRISKEHRLVYRLEEDEILIIQCRHHY